MANTIWKEVFLIMCSSSKENARNTERFSLTIRITDNYTLQILCGAPHNVGNEEGKMRGLPLNRAVYVQDNDKKEMVDIICGKFFICYAPPESESFQSLPDDMMKKYKEQFKYPERFSKEVGGNIVAEPFKPKSKDYER